MGIPCRVCCDRNTSVIENRNLSLYRCNACGHVFKDIPKEMQEQYGEDYFSKVIKNWFVYPDYPLFDFIYREILKFKGDKRLKVLDIGCGKGAFLNYLKKKNRKFELYGIDLTDNHDQYIHFIKGDILKDEIDIKFDIICSITVIEHINTPYQFMKKIDSLLASDGILFIITDNNDSMIYNIARLLKRVGITTAFDRLYATHHLHCFSNKSLEILMQINGFNIIKQVSHNCPVRAVNYPETNIITAILYRIAVRIIFVLSRLFRNGILQIIICKKKAKLN